MAARSASASGRATSRVLNQYPGSYRRSNKWNVFTTKVKRRERRRKEGGRGRARGARRRIIDVRTFVSVLYIGRDGLLPMQSVIPAA